MQLQTDPGEPQKDLKLKFITEQLAYTAARLVVILARGRSCILGAREPRVPKGVFPNVDIP